MWHRFILLLFVIYTTDTVYAQTLAPPEPSRIYLNFCASCHGANGDGFGKAARFLFPKPRAFLSSPLQYATAKNRIASPENIKQTILEGVPNSSMSGWNTLTNDQIDSLVNDVIQFRRYGAQKRYLNLLFTNGEIDTRSGLELLTEDQTRELSSYMQKETEPDSEWEAPTIPGFSPSAERGKALYRAQNCHKCHGEDYRGSYGIDLSGEYGFPAFASDLRKEPLKYGDEKTDIMRTIQLGVYGTKMPASTTLTSEQLLDLVELISTINSPGQPELTNAERYQRAIGNLPKRR